MTVGAPQENSAVRGGGNGDHRDTICGQGVKWERLQSDVIRNARPAAHPEQDNLQYTPSSTTCITPRAGQPAVHPEQDNPQYILSRTGRSTPRAVQPAVHPSSTTSSTPRAGQPAAYRLRVSSNDAELPPGAMQP